jgi:catalase
MKKSFAVFLGLLAIAPITHASLASTTSTNVSVLNQIPLFEGLEEKSCTEDSQASTLVGIFTKIQAESHKGQPALNRGTHAKGSCFDGSLDILTADQLQASGVDSATVARVQKGLFAVAGQLPALIRFANAKGDRNADTVGDVRGLSFSVNTTGRAASFNGDQAQDFMMNTSPMFAVNNIHEFTELMKLSRVTQGDFHYIVNPIYLKSDLRAKKLLDTYERNDTVSFATESYWGNLPYSHGLNANGTASEVVKYKLTPCDGRSAHAPSAGKAKDYLQTDISARAAAGKVCFNLQVQLFDQAKLASAGVHPNWSRTDWIENGGELWDEAILPYVTIAQLTASPKQIACDDIGFSTRLHATRANQPLGGIARVRAFVEENSRARRMKK